MNFWQNKSQDQLLTLVAHGQEEGRGKGGRRPPEMSAVCRRGALGGPGQALLLDKGDGGDAAEGGVAPVGVGGWKMQPYPHAISLASSWSRGLEDRRRRRRR